MSFDKWVSLCNRIFNPDTERPPSRLLAANHFPAPLPFFFLNNHSFAFCHCSYVFSKIFTFIFSNLIMSLILVFLMFVFFGSLTTSDLGFITFIKFETNYGHSFLSSPPLPPPPIFLRLRLHTPETTWCSSIVYRDLFISFRHFPPSAVYWILSIALFQVHWSFLLQFPLCCYLNQCTLHLWTSYLGLFYTFTSLIIFVFFYTLGKK